tara:strand:+ start:2014 stop:4185 length:2172 start_codon:yes stop_codon:yes gene_type:complete
MVTHRYNWIDWVKALGIILVVVGHCPGIGEGLRNWIYSFHMPLFFVISGFLLSKKNVHQSWKEFYSNRLSKLLYGYLLFGVIGVAAFIVLSQVSQSVQLPPIVALVSGCKAFLYGSGSLHLEWRLYPLVLWFFPALIVSLMLFKVIRGLGVKAQFGLVFLSALAGYLLKSQSLPWEVESALAALPFIYLGHIFRLRSDWQNLVGKLGMPMIVMLIVGASWLGVNYGIRDFRSSDFGVPVIGILSSCVMLVALIALAMKLPSSRIVTNLSAASIFIFPMHVLMLVAIDSLVKRMSFIPEGFIDSSFLYAIVESCVTIVVLTLAYPFFTRFFSFLGGKSLRVRSQKKHNPLKNMKIAYVMPYTYWGGGLQMNRLTLLQELVDYEDLDITIIVLEYSGKTSQLFKEMGLKEVCLKRKAKFIYPRTSYALYKALKEIDPDIIHTGNVDADIHGYLATRFLTKPKLVVEEIGSAQDRKPIMRKICGYVYQRADKVLCVSPDILEDMKELQGLKREDVSLTYNPVNLTHLKTTADAVQRICTTYKLNGEEFLFGIVSRFELFKGHTYLFEAYENFVKKHKNTKLLVIGDGPLKADFIAEVSQRGLSDNVIFTGMVDGVGDYLSLIDVFVHPSTKEPFGISIIEAMYMEKAVISTSVGGPKNYIQNGQNGVLVEPRNSNELATAMTELYEDSEKRITLGECAKKTVVERFLPANYAREIYSIYQSVLRGE